MTAERSLFERIRRGEQGGERSLRVAPEEQAESVMRHLQKMLNVRQGGVPALPSYGMPDFNDMIFRFPDAIFEIQRAIRRSIEEYEPRLKRVRVTHVVDEDDPLNLRFEIRAQLVTGTLQESIWFETIVDTAGHISVRG